MNSFEKVLVVEDDPDIREILGLALGDLSGLQVRACASVGEALAALDDFHPQLIALDVMLPEISGVEAIPIFRARPDCSALPVVLLTAKASREHALEYQSLPIQGVIFKPFDPLTLGAQLAAIYQDHVASDSA